MTLDSLSPTGYAPANLAELEALALSWVNGIRAARGEPALDALPRATAPPGPGRALSCSIANAVPGDASVTPDRIRFNDTTIVVPPPIDEFIRATDRGEYPHLEPERPPRDPAILARELLSVANGLRAEIRTHNGASACGVSKSLSEQLDSLSAEVGALR